VPRFAELYEAFRQPLQAAISCFTRATLLTRPPFTANRAILLWLSQEPAALGRRPAFFLRFAHTYRIAQRAGEWEVQTTSYSYWLLDTHQNELVVYQWDTTGGSKVLTPHLHIRALAALPKVGSTEEPPLTASKEAIDLLVRAHLPTGHILLSQILRMVVDDLGVEPLEADRDRVQQRLVAADEVLRASLAWQSPFRTLGA